MQFGSSTIFGTLNVTRSVNISGYLKAHESLNIKRSTSGDVLSLIADPTETDISIFLGLEANTNSYRLTYHGTGAGNENDLSLSSSTATLFRSHQDGIVDFQSGANVSGSAGLAITGGPGTIGGSNLSNGWLRVGSSLAMDDNEIYFGTAGHIGTIGAYDLRFVSNGNEMYLRSNGEIDTPGTFGTSSSWTTFKTPHGNIQLGPANTSYAHIYTDRASFYFNKNILINGTSVSLSNHSHSYLPLSGGAMTGEITFTGTQGIRNRESQGSAYVPLKRGFGGSSTTLASYPNYSHSTFFVESASSGFGLYGCYETIKMYSNNAGIQFFYPYNAGNADYPIKYRLGDYSGTTWYAWKSLASQEWVNSNRISNKLTVASSAPSGPSTNDIWIDTSA
jgi:hypothetical protein